MERVYNTVQNNQASRLLSLRASALGLLCRGGTAGDEGSFFTLV